MDLPTAVGGPNSANSLFLCAIQAKNGFYIFKWLKIF